MSDANDIYYLSNPGLMASPVSAPCNPSTTVLAPVTSVAAMTSDASYIYWITPTGAVQKTSKNAHP